MGAGLHCDHLFAHICWRQGLGRRTLGAMRKGAPVHGPSGLASKTVPYSTAGLQFDENKFQGACINTGCGGKRTPAAHCAVRHRGPRRQSG